MAGPTPRTTAEKRAFEAEWDAAVERFERLCLSEGTHKPRTWVHPQRPCVRCGAM